jgi:hypothetical protein
MQVKMTKRKLAEKPEVQPIQKRKTIKTFSAVVYYADGTQVKFEGSKKFFDLEWMQAQVNGQIETIPIDSDRKLIAVLNESGRVSGMIANTGFAKDYPKTIERFGEQHGPVIVLPKVLV